MLTNVLLGTSSPDASGRTADIGGAGVDGEFSKVISETEKASQAIEIKQENIEETAPDAIHPEHAPALPGQAVSAPEKDDGLMSIEESDSEFNQQVLVSEQLPAPGRADLPNRSLTAYTEQAAEALRSVGRFLPGPVGMPSMQPPEAQTRLAEHPITAARPQDMAATSSSANASVADPTVKSSTVSISSQQAGTLAHSTSVQSAPPSSVSAAEHPDQMPLPADHARRSETQTRPDGVISNPNPASIGGSGSRVPEPAAAPGADVVSASNTNPSNTASRTLSDRGAVNAGLQSADRAKAEDQRAFLQAAGRGEAAGDNRGLALNLQSTPQSTSGTESGAVSGVRNPLTDAGQQSLAADSQASTLAARLNQLNATNRATLEEMPQSSINAAAKGLLVSSEPAPAAAAPGVVAASLSVLQKSEANQLSIRGTSRERTLSGEARPLENPTSPSTGTTSGDSVRADTAVLRSDSSAAMAQLPAALARQVLRSHAQNVSELRLQLKPEELGSLELKLRVDGDRVHVAMLTAQPGVKDLLEAQLPQLRTLLEQGGLQLGDVDVAERSPDGNTSGDSEQLADHRDTSAVDAGAADLPATALDSQPQGLIDAFV